MNYIKELLKSYSQSLDQPEYQVRSQTNKRILDRFNYQIRKQPYDQVGYQLWDQLWEYLFDQFRTDQLTNQLRRKLWCQLKGKFNEKD